MKKIIALLLAMILPVCAGAETISHNTGAPEAVTEVLTSNTGKIQITIDASVELPEVEQVSIFEVSPMPVPAENVLALADCLMGVGTWMGPAEYAADNYGDNTDATTTQASESMLILGYDMRTMLSARAQLREGTYHGSLQVLYDKYSENVGSGQDRPFAAEVLHDTCSLYALRNTDAAGCSLSYEEAEVLARQAAASVAPELTEMRSGVALGRDGETQAYEFIFYRLLEGIPVTYSVTRGTQDLFSTALHKEPWPYEALRIMVYGDLGIGTLFYESPYQIGEVLENDLSLLSFDQIMEIASSILPLTLSHLEREGKTVTANVYRISFGYARVDVMDEPYQYKLVPAWDFFGVVDDDSRREYAFDNYSLLTINAIDGMVIDRSYGY